MSQYENSNCLDTDPNTPSRNRFFAETMDRAVFLACCFVDAALDVLCMIIRFYKNKSESVQFIFNVAISWLVADRLTAVITHYYHIGLYDQRIFFYSTLAIVFLFCLCLGKRINNIGSKRETIPDLTEVLCIAPNDWECLRDRGKLRYNNDDYGGAIDDLTKSLMINPKSKYAYEYRGLCHSALTQYLEAIDDFTKAIKIDPSSYTAYAHRADCNRNQGALIEAIEDYCRSLKIKADYAYAYYGRGTSYLALEMKVEAADDLYRATELSPHSWYGQKAGEEMDKDIELAKIRNQKLKAKIESLRAQTGVKTQNKSSVQMNSRSPELVEQVTTEAVK